MITGFYTDGKHRRRPITGRIYKRKREDTSENSMSNFLEDLKNERKDYKTQEYELVQSEKENPKTRFYCPECDSKIETSYPAKCEKCGWQGYLGDAPWENIHPGKVEDNIKRVQCLSCGDMVVRSKFCSKCGADMTDMDDERRYVEEGHENTPFEIPSLTKASILKKLRRIELSGKMSAIMGYLLDENWTHPNIAELSITTDGVVLAREEGDIGFNLLIGHDNELIRNIDGLLQFAELDKTERKYIHDLMKQKIFDNRMSPD